MHGLEVLPRPGHAAPRWVAAMLAEGRAALQERDEALARERQRLEEIEADARAGNWRALCSFALEDLTYDLYRAGRWLGVPEEWRGHSLGHDAVLDLPGVGLVAARFGRDRAAGPPRWERRPFTRHDLDPPQSGAWAAVAFELFFDRAAGRWDTRQSPCTAWPVADGLPLALALAEREAERRRLLWEEAGVRNTEIYNLRAEAAGGDDPTVLFARAVRGQVAREVGLVKAA